MNQPNQRGFRQAQGASPLAIRTKKSQLDTNTYTKLAMAQVWRKEWWYALIPFAIGLLPAVIWHSWWWLALAALLTLLYVLLRSAQITGVTQMEQSKALFERFSYEIDAKQIVMRLNEREGRALPWNMIGKAKRDAEGYLLWLQAPEMPAELKGWRLWVARTFETPMFLQLPLKIFNSPNDIKLFDSMLRRKNLLPAATGLGNGPASA
ncbi:MULTISPECIES: hypothetical protein [Hymenobacter]|uniref:YcxB family protein n=1 Tax=Hymenobacter jejuensis TaxID=2502781 RepID=A0A5B8A0J2_9BACT|nr:MULTISPECIES: hypothetical protein [Hymenobacter]MBC6991871.1 hypothetical protein [Hymenobacter sp. BT491]QDA60185.1 hypothetical protein FHG12_08720 [Hymenobacter jejuensis]